MRFTPSSRACEVSLDSSENPGPVINETLWPHLACPMQLKRVLSAEPPRSSRVMICRIFTLRSPVNYRFRPAFLIAVPYIIQILAEFGPISKSISKNHQAGHVGFSHSASQPANLSYQMEKVIQAHRGRLLSLFSLSCSFSMWARAPGAIMFHGSTFSGDRSSRASGARSPLSHWLIGTVKPCWGRSNISWGIIPDKVRLSRRFPSRPRTFHDRGSEAERLTASGEQKGRSNSIPFAAERVPAIGVSELRSHVLRST